MPVRGEREMAMALAVLGAGRHLLLEGPVGVGKTTVALAVCSHLGRDTVRVDGDDRYSEIRTAETASQRKIEMSYIGG